MPIVIEGLKELNDLLQNETPRAAKRMLTRVADEAAQVVIAAMKETVPVKEGVLEESIVWSKKFANDGDETTMNVKVGPSKPYFYGTFAEFGTATQPATHWMGGAWESCQEEVLNKWKTGLIGMLLDLENKKK